MATKSEDSTFLVVLNGLKISTAMKADIEKKIRAVVMQEIATIDHGDGITIQPLKSLPQSRSIEDPVGDLIRRGGTAGLVITKKVL